MVLVARENRRECVFVRAIVHTNVMNVVLSSCVLFTVYFHVREKHPTHPKITHHSPTTSQSRISALGIGEIVVREMNRWEGRLSYDEAFS